MLSVTQRKNTEAGITHYIDDMKGVPEINYRHIRNDLAHRQGAFDEEICTQEPLISVQNDNEGGEIKTFYFVLTLFFIVTIVLAIMLGIVFMGVILFGNL